MFDFKAQLKILPNEPGVYLMKKLTWRDYLCGKSKNIEK